MMNDDTITRDELEAALRRLNYSLNLHSSMIFDDVIRHRDRDWQAGEVAIDANGEVWRAVNYCDAIRWQQPGSSSFYPYNAPKRPLQQMKAVDR